MNNLSRRFFMSSSAFAAGTAALSLVSTSQSSAARADSDGLLAKPDLIDDGFGRVRRVIFAVSDGMSMGTMTLGDLYSQTVLGRESFWPRLMMQPGVRSGLCTTHSADSLVTDSAAASTTWSSGEKTYNKSIGYSVDRQPLTPILTRMHQAGYRTGLVTTAKVTDATPAGFVANVPVRTMEQQIADQILERTPNVVLGGGARYFSEHARSAFEGRYITNPRAIGDSRQTRSLIGMFAEDHIPYTLDRNDDDADLLSMTREAIEQLDYLQGGYLMQVEAARVDHAAHNNDAISMIHEQIEFDRTLEHLVRYAADRDDTLVFITTDHGNGNPGINVYTDSAQRGLMSLANARKSFDWIFDELRERDAELRNASLQREVIEYATGVALKNSDLAYLNPKAEGRANLFYEADSVTSRLGSLLANRSGVAFSSKNHTSDMVVFSAVGAGADLFPPVIDNTDILPRLLHLMGIERMADAAQIMVRS